MVLDGSAISDKDISARVLSDWFVRFRTSLYAMTASLETGLTRISGRPISNILAATDPHVVALARGSIRVVLRLPEPEMPAEGPVGGAISHRHLFRRCCP